MTLRMADSEQKPPSKNQRDDWINRLLLGDDELNGSLFQTAHKVIQQVLNSGNGSVCSLRRVHTFSSNDSDASMSNNTAHLFEPLFGPNNQCNDDTKEVVSVKHFNHKKSKRKRINLKLTVAYKGSDFCGWEDQRHDLYRKETYKSVRDLKPCEMHSLPSVQGTLVDVLDPIFGRKTSNATLASARLNDSKTMPIEIKVAGRTDAGVSAIAQICRIRIWSNDLSNRRIELDQSTGKIECYVTDIVNEYTASIGIGLRIINVQKVDDKFHPTFGATCRAYVYLIDLTDEESSRSRNLQITESIVPKLDRMLTSLEGQSLDYFAFSYGKVKTQTTLCRLICARASLVELNSSDNKGPIEFRTPLTGQAICIELVGDRFLRRMVRILVATALREVLTDAENENALINILKTRERANAAPEVPPDGLIFVGAGYG